MHANEGLIILEYSVGSQLLASLRSKLVQELGYGTHATIDPIVKETLDEVLDTAEKIVKPRGMYRILPVLDTDAEGVLTRVGTIRSAMFARLLGKCTGNPSIVFMVATLGNELESRCGTQAPLYRQMVFDSAGSILVETVADMVEADWRGRLNRLGFQYSLRLSPGYCDWALDGQRLMAASLNTEKVGIHLTSDFIMIPSKSISAIAATARQVPIAAPCSFCKKSDCLSRRSTDGLRCRHDTIGESISLGSTTPERKST